MRTPVSRARVGVVLPVLALAGCGSGAPEFRSMRGLNNYAMIVTNGTDPASLPELAKAKCGQVDQCSVYAWRDAASAATALPMTDRDVAAEVFSYSINRNSGFEQALWNCRVYPPPSKAECLSGPES
jgi:hypothetical protein